MGLFGFGKKIETARDEQVSAAQHNGTSSNEELYGKAWLMIVVEDKRKQQGLDIIRDLHARGFDEATIVLAMFSESQEQRKSLVKQAADAGNVEGLWEYCGFLPHSYCPNPGDPGDALWEKYCLDAAEGGSVDAMNEMGNVFNRRGNFAESMYWYAMANAFGHPGGGVSLSGIARKWAMTGCPYDFQKGSPKFDEARHKCAIAYLEMHANKKLSVNMSEIMILVQSGVPIAAYLAGDIYESLEKHEMAYRMYNMISFENDPHGLRCYADMLFAGRGVQKDVQSAIRFYQMAAERGEREAMFIMGEFVKDSNKNLAAYWYGLSHTRGYEHALARLTQLAE